MASNSQTRDGAPEGWLVVAGGRAGEPLEPRLRLLYHSDLTRFGELSLPGSIPPGEGWLTLGRNEPQFAPPGAAPARSLGDPHVSREQLRVRWLAGAGRFEVEPAAAARRPVSRVDLSGGVPTLTAITGPTLLEPGACVAVSDRVLVGLELGRCRAPDADRMGLVGESEAVWALRDEIRSVAAFGGATLVTGPTGAGKELVARALHRESAQARGPFVPVNCAALPENLVESVLFGHRKGAFTGADAEEKGLFRAAEGGTLFFDELGELPLSVQPKLLRVLQDGVVVPVGAHDGRRVDVRVVAATHRDLEAQMRAGQLREDLYHRVAAHVVRVPSLAERRFDIPELFVHMLGRLRGEYEALGWLWTAGKEGRQGVPIGFLAGLLARELRGNVRELGNLVERTARLNLHPGAFRAPDATPAPAQAPASVPPSVSTPSPVEVSAAATPADEALVRAACETLGVAPRTLLKLLAPEALLALGAEAEREGLDAEGRARKLGARAAEALLALLEAHGFNQSAAAADLGASRTTLIKLMEDLRLPRATDLDAAAITRACAGAGGDVDQAARALRVSVTALRKRMAALGLKPPG
jgi:DNA-binding NtrC family response regulator